MAASEGRKLKESFRHCRRVVRGSSSNFAWSFWLLPKPQRKAMVALYAFARRTDDLADGPGSGNAEKRASLAAWRRSLESALAGEEAQQPLLLALAETRRQFNISRQYLFDLIDGVEMDLSQNRYENLEELLCYCYRVASSVGLVCLQIWGCRDPEAQTPAIACGYAMQLTNILRDLGEDADRNRIYLPRSDLKQFRVCEASILKKQPTTEFSDLIQFQVERARDYYRQAAALEPRIPAPSRRMFRVIHATYQSLLNEVEKLGPGILKQRAALRPVQKLRLGISAWSSKRLDGPSDLKPSSLPIRSNEPTP